MNSNEHDWLYLKPDDQQWRSQGGQGEAECPLDSEKFAKNREKEETKIRKRREKIGKRENREGSFTFPPSDRWGWLRYDD